MGIQVEVIVQLLHPKVKGFLLDPLEAVVNPCQPLEIHRSVHLLSSLDFRTSTPTDTDTTLPRHRAYRRGRG